MKQALINNGEVNPYNVPAPEIGNKNILVNVINSCISVGTEISGVKNSGMPLYERALKQPKNVKKVIDLINSQGLINTYERIKEKVNSPMATGYSASGYVIGIGKEVENFRIGDKVACGGAGVANHAEIIDVPVNLASKIPDSVSFEDASTITLGAIAMQGIRRAEPTIGETFLVIGLGVIGQITNQLLQCNGCNVIGVDIDDNRLKVGKDNNIDYLINPQTDNFLELIQSYTNYMGVDGVIITAASQSNQIIKDAMQASRKKGRVVIVGDIGLNLEREDFYKKELNLLISCSYGPGRYDPYYEENGQDYPFPYVRWTENRNMKAYIHLLEKNKVNLSKLTKNSFPINKVKNAYKSIQSEENPPLLVFLKYETISKEVERTFINKDAGKSSKDFSKINISIIGGSSFAKAIHIPNLIKLKKYFQIRSIVSRTGANAMAIAKQYKIGKYSTDFKSALEDQKVNLIFIANRPNLHGSMIIDSLKNGKNVFVEKPLTIDENEFSEIKSILKKEGLNSTLMVGFNRRYSPPIKAIKNIISEKVSPLIINYEMNAGYIENDSWIQGEENGSRNLSEACHIYDLFNFLVNSHKVIDVKATSIIPNDSMYKTTDNFIATLKYDNGSICNLTYTSLGNRNSPKEKMTIFFDRKIIEMIDYKKVVMFDKFEKQIWKSNSQQKGLYEEIECLGNHLSKGLNLGITNDEIISSTTVAFDIEKLIK